MIKAYHLSIKDDYDAGNAIVFAETPAAAKNQIYSTTLGDNVEDWIDIRVRRDKRYDGMENLSEADLALEQWKDGWRWFDEDYPDPDEATDAEFLTWYEDAFGGKHE